MKVVLRPDGEDLVIRVQIHGHCEDCDIRGALSPVGLPMRHPNDVTPLRGTSIGTRIQMGRVRRLTDGCEGCGGNGKRTTMVARIGLVSFRRALTAKQRFVIERRVGYGTARSRHTLASIGRSMGISPQAVWKLEQAGAERLGRLVYGKKWKDDDYKDGLDSGFTEGEVEKSGLISEVGEGTFSPDPAPPTEAIDEHGSETVSLSPFLSHRVGFAPGALPNGVGEWLNGDGDHD